MSQLFFNPYFPKLHFKLFIHFFINFLQALSCQLYRRLFQLTVWGQSAICTSESLCNVQLCLRLDLENRTATMKHYRLFLLLFHAIYSPMKWMNEDKNFGSPQEAFLHLQFLEKLPPVSWTFFFILVLKIGTKSFKKALYNPLTFWGYPAICTFTLKAYGLSCHAN